MSRRRWQRTVGVGILVAVILRLFFFSTYVIDGVSMQPTLENGDLVVLGRFRVSTGIIRQGDIVVFHKNETDDFIKRVIGVAGDEITASGDILYVNGERKDEIEEIRRGTGTFTLEEKTGENQVPLGYVFVSGDNRDESYDSHSFGFVPVSAIVGVLDLRYWPITSFGFF